MKNLNHFKNLIEKFDEEISIKKEIKLEIQNTLRNTCNDDLINMLNSKKINSNKKNEISRKLQNILIKNDKSTDYMDIDYDNHIYKKQQIYKPIREIVWIKYCGDKTFIGNCFCCNKKFNPFNFECGHVISSFFGGDLSISNLRPICSVCNKSMGIKNMEEFMNECKFKKSNHWNGYIEIINIEY
jgi:5-methylcytosine-specific restriction endonuclease McrA